MAKGTLSLLIGTSVGVFVAPNLLNMLNIPASEGFGMDDIATAAIIVGTTMLINQIF